MSRFSKASIIRIVIRGFRSLENVTVDLKPVTVLVGPNGSGKSSFVDALAFLRQALEKSPQAAFESRGGFNQVLTRTGTRPQAVSIDLQVQSRSPAAFTSSYFVRFAQKERPVRLVIEERCEIKIGPEREARRFAVENGEWQESVGGI